MTKKAMKEAIKNAPKFIAYIDYKAASEKSLEYVARKAQDIISTMDEAEALKTADVYLMRIAENTGNVTEENMLVYIDKLCTRSCNWYHNDAAHGESTCTHNYGLEYECITFGERLEQA